MVYSFVHFPTLRGRLVRFVIASECYRAAVRTAPAIRAGVVLERPDAMDPVASTAVTMRVDTARQLADVLASIGGDAAICARELQTRLEGMVVELRTARALAAAPNFWRRILGNGTRRPRVA